jgi:hypothetical protein
VEERERIADEKRRENDPSAADEYRVAIGQAEAGAADAAEPLREALLLLESPPAGAAGLEGRQEILRAVAGLTPEERYDLKRRVGEMTESEREATLRWLSSSGPRDALLDRLSGAVDAWRAFRAASARLRAHCGGACGG